MLQFGFAFGSQSWRENVIYDGLDQKSVSLLDSFGLCNSLDVIHLSFVDDPSLKVHFTCPLGYLCSCVLFRKIHGNVF